MKMKPASMNWAVSRDIERTRSFVTNLRYSTEQRLWTAKYDNTPRLTIASFCISIPNLLHTYYWQVSCQEPQIQPKSVQVNSRPVLVWFGSAWNYSQVLNAVKLQITL